MLECGFLHPNFLQEDIDFWTEIHQTIDRTCAQGKEGFGRLVWFGFLTKMGDGIRNLVHMKADETIASRENVSTLFLASIQHPLKSMGII